MPKIDELRALCQAEKPHCVCIVESWLSQDISNSELFIPNYTIVRHDRNRHGGGVLIYSLSALSTNTVFKGSVDLELLIVSLNVSGSSVVVALMYRPPNVSDSVFDDLFLFCAIVSMSLCSIILYLLVILM